MARRPQAPRVRFQLCELEERAVPGLIDSIKNRIQSEVEARQQQSQATTTPATTAPTPTVRPAPTDRAADNSLLLLDTQGNPGNRVQAFTANEPNFNGGMWVARGDVTGDGIPESITATGAGTLPLVNVFDGKTGQLYRSFLGYERSFTGGMFVTTADFNGDGRVDVVVGTDEGGGPRVRVFDGTSDTRTLADFLAINDGNFRGGVRVSTGDINGDGVDDLMVSAGFGGGPRISLYDGKSIAAGKPTNIGGDFFAFEDSLRNGAHVALGYVNDDKYADLIVGGGPGGAPRVRVFDGATLVNQGFEAALAKPLADFFAGDNNDRGGVRVGTILGDNKLNLILAVRSTGDATAFTLDGKTVRTVNRELALNAGIIDDNSARHGAGPVAVDNNAVTLAFKGTYTGTFPSRITPDSTGVDVVENATATLDVFDVTYPFGIATFRQSGGPATWTGKLTISLPNRPTLIINVSGEFNVDPFPNQDVPPSARFNLINRTFSSISDLVSNGPVILDPSIDLTKLMDPTTGEIDMDALEAAVASASSNPDPSMAYAEGLTWTNGSISGMSLNYRLQGQYRGTSAGTAYTWKKL